MISPTATGSGALGRISISAGIPRSDSLWVKLFAEPDRYLLMEGAGYVTRTVWVIRHPVRW